MMDDLSKKDRVWIPYQFCSEFYKNRKDRIDQEFKRKEIVIGKLDSLEKDLYSSYFNDQEHFTLKIDSIVKDLQNTITRQKNKINKNKCNPDWREPENDIILKRLEKILKDKIGNDYDDDKKSAIESEINKRARIKKQPGVSDIGKSNGDTIAWFQILDYSENLSKPIILVTEETKDDFWEEKKRNDKIFPRRSLVKEFHDKSGKLFSILNLEEFIKYITEKNYVPLFDNEKEIVENEVVVGSSVVGVDSSLLNNEQVTN